LIELGQVRRRHVQAAHRFGLCRAGQRGRHARGRRPPHPQQDGFDIVALAAATSGDHLADVFDAMVFQQLQDADEVAHAAGRTVLLLQRGPQVAEQRWQLPAPEDVGMVEGRRPPLQSAQIMLRVEDVLVLGIRARMRRDDLAAEHHGDVVHIGLHGHGLEGRRPRHAVTVVVVAHRLVLVGLGRLDDAGVEGPLRQ
jgi:hypothetical protein